jgi:hypothetical protein
MSRLFMIGAPGAVEPRLRRPAEGPPAIHGTLGQALSVGVVQEMWYLYIY